MKTDQEQLIEEIVSRVKAGRDISDLPKNPTTNSYVKMIRTLNNFPKATIETPNFDRVRNQILDRIAIPQEEPVAGTFGMVLAAVPRFLKIGGAVIGSFLILSSLALGVSVAALQSLPGQPIYPVKKVVERVQLKLTADEAEKTNLEIKFANNRLEELEKLILQNQQGKVSGAEVQRIAEQTVSDISKTTSKVSQNTNPDQPQTQILTKLVDLTSKQTALLQTASVNEEGQVKLELQKALEASKVSQEKTLADIERAGLRVDETTTVISAKQAPDEVTASGKITALNSTTISIGTAKFLLTKDTKFVNITQDALEVDQIVDIKGQIIQDKTYALEIKIDPDSIKAVEPDSEANPDSESSE